MLKSVKFRRISYAESFVACLRKKLLALFLFTGNKRRTHTHAHTTLRQQAGQQMALPFCFSLPLQLPCFTQPAAFDSFANVLKIEKKERKFAASADEMLIFPSPTVNSFICIAAYAPPSLLHSPLPSLPVLALRIFICWLGSSQWTSRRNLRLRHMGKFTQMFLAKFGNISWQAHAHTHIT